MVVVVQRRLLVRRVGGVCGVQRRQVVVPPRELRRDDVLEVLQESRRLEAGIFQLWWKQIQDAAVARARKAGKDQAGYVIKTLRKAGMYFTNFSNSFH